MWTSNFKYCTSYSFEQKKKCSIKYRKYQNLLQKKIISLYLYAFNKFLKWIIIFSLIVKLLHSRKTVKKKSIYINRALKLCIWIGNVPMIHNLRLTVPSLLCTKCIHTQMLFLWIFIFQFLLHNYLFLIFSDLFYLFLFHLSKCVMALDYYIFRFISIFIQKRKRKDYFTSYSQSRIRINFKLCVWIIFLPLF